MSKFLENKLSMFHAVMTFLQANLAKLSAIPAFATAVEDFGSVLDQIQSKGIEVDTASAGKAEKKAIAEEELIDAVIPVASALSVMAAVSKDAELSAKVSVREWALRKMRDTDLARTAAGVKEAAAAHTEDGADFGLTAEMVTTLETKTKAYSKAMGERESSVGQRIAARSAMVGLFDEADSILTGRIDNLMGLMRNKEPQLCEEYNATRIIRDAGLRHRPVAPPQEQEATPA